MSKRFKTQDYHRLKRLGTRWRKPKGRHSKQRVRKPGSGIKASAGYRTPRETRYSVRGYSVAMVANEADLERVKAMDKKAIIIASSIGSRKTAVLGAKAKELGLHIMNMNKLRRAEKLTAALAKRRESKKEEKKKEEAKAKEKKEAKKTREAEEQKENAAPVQHEGTGKAAI
ncbi:MAG: hypothetical protein HYY37_06055 [Candidatus Aenigmarchaeota archaeon]|nr:hypothetical protein [Candidatus Aenigmarchaeota archaeon]